MKLEHWLRRHNARIEATRREFDRQYGFVKKLYRQHHWAIWFGDPQLCMVKGGYNDLGRWKEFGGTLDRPSPPAGLRIGSAPWPEGFPDE
jgi:hypothetical protein